MDKVIKAIQYRLDSLNKTLDLVKKEPNLDRVTSGLEARIDELESLLAYVSNT